jgi:hypothetical protein
MKTPTMIRSAVAAALFGVALGASAQHDLTIVSWGGAYQDGQKEVFFKPYNAAGTKLIDESWDGGIGVLRTKIKGGNNNWDVVQVEADELEIGCDEGLYERMDFAKIGGQGRYLPGTTHPCGVGAIIYNLVLAYDGDKLKTAPTGWADFFDSKKFPRQARDPQRREVEPRGRADRRRRSCEGCLHGAALARRRRPRVSQARHDQARPRVLEERRAAAADARGRRRRDDDRVQRPHHRSQREGQEELQDGLEGHALDDGQLGDHERARPTRPAPRSWSNTSAARTTRPSCRSTCATASPRRTRRWMRR